jgi:hypothetical protein
MLLTALKRSRHCHLLQQHKQQQQTRQQQQMRQQDRTAQT